MRLVDPRYVSDDVTHHGPVPVSEEHGSNSSVSSVISSVGSMSITESSERSFHSLSQLQEIRKYQEVTLSQFFCFTLKNLPLDTDTVVFYLFKEFLCLLV